MSEFQTMTFVQLTSIYRDRAMRGIRAKHPPSQFLSVCYKSVILCFSTLSSDYAVEIFDRALQSGQYTCYLKPDATLPMIYVDDCLRGIAEMLEAPEGILTQRTYNINAIAFSPEELAEELRKYVPRLDMVYKPDSRQEIGKVTKNQSFYRTFVHRCWWVEMWRSFYHLRSFIIYGYLFWRITVQLRYLQVVPVFFGNTVRPSSTIA